MLERYSALPVELSSGCSPYGNGQVTTYSYDTWLGLSGMDQPGTSYDQTYSRDYTGKITAWTKGAASALAFSYDGLGRLASGEGVGYGYDTTGNMITAAGGDPSTFTYQVGSTGSNSMLIDSTTGAATVDYSTDTEGNVVQATGRYGTLSYDFSNRVTSIADTAREVTDTYAYDASGLRYKKTESINGAEVETFTVYSGNDILLEETYSEGAWKTARIEFTVAGASAGRFEKDYSTSQEAVRFYYQDHLGSRIGVADEAGAVLATIAYDVWGNATASGIAGYDAESEIRFTGKPMDAMGLYYFNARYYDPQSKRFLTEDPIQQGLNWYTYCGNDPVNATDPDGMRYVESVDGNDTRENRQIERQHQADEKSRNARDRSNERIREANRRGEDQIQKAFNIKLGEKYKIGVNDCDIWVETGFKDGGVDITYKWGPAKDTTVAKHKALVEELLNSDPMVEWSVVFFDDGHTGSIKLNLDNSVDVYHNGHNLHDDTYESRRYHYDSVSEFERRWSGIETYWSIK